MKNFALLLTLFLFCGYNAMATDRLVEENGLAPAYSTISAAITASSSGDRIFIKNRSGNVPWFENVSITKSLDFVCFVNDSVFICQGNWTIAGGSTPMNVNIIGMYNLAGSVTSTADATSPRDTVRLLGGALLNGQVNFNNNNYDLTVYGMKVVYTGATASQQGAVVFRHGSIIGDSIVTTNGAAGIYVVSEASVTNDTTYITGNVIMENDPNPVYNAGEFNGAGINWSCNTAFFDIRNNLVYFEDKGIAITTSRAVSTTINKIYNCSLVWTSFNNNFGCYYSQSCDGIGSYAWTALFLQSGGGGSLIEVMNNLMAKTVTNTNYTQYGIYGIPNGGSLNVYYNYIGTGWQTATIGGALTVNTNNNTSSAITSANFGGGVNVGNLTGNQVPTYPPSATNLGWCTVGTNSGNPGNVYFNLDKSINTVGAYGGSYTLLNYFPQNTGASRTWLSSYPFNANVGSTISIKANSFDR